VAPFGGHVHHHAVDAAARRRDGDEAGRLSSVTGPSGMVYESNFGYHE
jgi:hypothetical protein